MSRLLRSPRSAALLAVTAAATGIALAAPATAFASPASQPANHDNGRNLVLSQVNLASDVAGLAPLTDPDGNRPLGSFDASRPPLTVQRVVIAN